MDYFILLYKFAEKANINAYVLIEVIWLFSFFLYIEYYKVFGALFIIKSPISLFVL